MRNFHLISHHLCPYVQRAVIVLNEKDISHKRTYIDLANKPDWFLEISPLGKVPVLETQGTALFESQVIAEYVDEITPGSLHPADPLEKARHRSWIEFGSQALNDIAGFYSAKDADILEQKRKALRDKFKRIEEQTKGSYFAGETFHMIDGVWGTIFRYLDVFDQIGDFGFMDGLKKVQLWRQTVSVRQSVINAPPSGYHDRLERFLIERNSHLSRLMQANEAVAEQA